MRSFIHFKVGNGQKIHIWTDKWCSEVPLCECVNHHYQQKEAMMAEKRFPDLMEVLGTNLCRLLNDWELENVQEFFVML